MAKLTGQFTTPAFDANNNKINKPFLHGVVFVFNSTIKISKESDDKGKYSFDLANGSYDVSVYLKDATEKDRFDMRIGEKFVVTSATKADELEKWLQVIGDGGKDEVAEYYESLLAQMQTVMNKFQDDTQKDGTGRFVMQSTTKKNSLVDSGIYYSLTLEVPSLKEGMHGLALGNKFSVNNSGLDLPSRYANTFLHFYVQKNYSGDNLVVFFNGYRENVWALAVKNSQTGLWSKPSHFYSDGNTTIGNHGQLHNGSGAVKELLAIGQYGFGGNENIRNVTTFNPTTPVISEIFQCRDAIGLITAYHPVLQISGGTNFGRISIFNGAQAGAGGKMIVQGGSANSTGRAWESEVMLKAQYITDSNGNVKPASPTIQLHHDRIEHNNEFDKDNPPVLEHIENGIYRISNVREICKDGWTFNKPMNGKGQPYFMLKWEQVDNTTLIVRIFERTFDKNTGEFGFGEPRDIGENERWVDLHFEVDHERIAREEAQMQKGQEEYEEQARLKKEAEEKAQAEATAAWEAEMKRQEELEEAAILAEIEAERVAKEKEEAERLTEEARLAEEEANMIAEMEAEHKAEE